MKKCPYCAENIQDKAIKCRFCGESFKKKNGCFNCLIGCFLFVLICVLLLNIFVYLLFYLISFLFNGAFFEMNRYHFYSYPPLGVDWMNSAIREMSGNFINLLSGITDALRMGLTHLKTTI